MWLLVYTMYIQILSQSWLTSTPKEHQTRVIYKSYLSELYNETTMLINSFSL